MATSWTPLSHGVPLLQGIPLKGLERDHDASGGSEEATAEDDSDSGSAAVDETLAFPAPAPAAPTPTATSLVGEDSGTESVDEQDRGGKGCW